MRNPFDRLLLAQAVNRFGDGFFSIGVSWIIYTRTHSILPLGLLWAVYFLVVGAVQAAAGPVVDALDRRALLVGVNVVRAVIVGTPLVLSQVGAFHVAELYVAFVLLGIVGVPQASAVSAVVPALVSPDALVQADARLQGVTEAMYLVGPVVAGLTLALFGALFGLAVDGASFVVAAAALATLPSLRARPQGRGEGYWPSLRVGARVLWNGRSLRQLAALYILVQFTDVAFIVLSVPLVRTVLVGTTRGVGFLEASLSGGYLVGSWLIHRHAPRIARHRRLSLVLVFCLATAAIAAIPLLFWALLTQVVGGIADAIFQVEWQATFQRSVAGRQLGRVLMWQSAASRAASSLGAVAVALLAWRLGIPVAFAILGVGGAVIGAWVLRGLRRHPDEWAVTAPSES